MHFLKFLAGRLFTFVLVIFIGLTTVFIVPRLLPSDPVEAMIGQMMSMAHTMDPMAIESMRASLNASFGLEGSLWEQYWVFMTRIIVYRDFGPSLFGYPTPVMDIVGRALPWTFGLLMSSTLIAWVFGNAMGLIAGFRKNTKTSKVLEGIAIAFYPIPYYIFALALIILFSFIFPIFPLTFTVVGSPLTLAFWQMVIRNSILPAASIILTGLGWWMISMKTVASATAEEDYVTFARLKGIPERKIMTGIVLRNSALPQTTMLALQIGTIFGGAMITEVLFGFPGMGSLMHRSILNADYNLIMGTISFSIIAVAITTLVIDLLYPFIDPRIRYK